eukprot:scaffold55253_cov61-Phaeocystis_antarctica.AAC.22
MPHRAAAVLYVRHAAGPALHTRGGTSALSSPPMLTRTPRSLCTGYAYRPRACRSYRVPWHLSPHGGPCVALISWLSWDP